MWWVELAALEDPELLASTLGSALGARERPGRSPAEVLIDHVGGRRILLVLDNCNTCWVLWRPS